MDRYAQFKKITCSKDAMDKMRAELSNQLDTLELRLNQLSSGETEKEVNLYKTYKEMIRGRQAMLQNMSVSYFG